MKLCSNCSQRPPLFRVRGGPVKMDDKHSLCMQCYRDQRNSIYARRPVVKELKSLDKRHSVLNELIVDGEVVYKGKDLPDPEDPTDPVFTAKVYITDSGAGTEVIYASGPVATNIPALRIASWDRESIKYLKHWLFKVLDDHSIYRANEIHIEATGSWRHQFKK